MPDMKMQPSELREIHAHIAKVSAQDFHLGRVLSLFAHHLGHAHGLDLAQMDEEAAVSEATKEQEESAPESEDESTADEDEDETVT
ncbi:MAG: hypothetical protein ACRDHW_06375, partial [Ktedonobacteraceae bacterium]